MLSLRSATPLALAMLAYLVSTTSVPQHGTCPRGQVQYTTAFDANFDDITAAPGTGITQVPTPYKQIFFQAFRVVNTVQTNLAPGIAPHSPTSYAQTGAIAETQSGDPMMTLNYQNSPTSIKSFALSSFYYGCIANLANGAAGVPLDCRITFTGFSGNDNTISDSTQVCSASFEYHPSTMVGVQQQAFTGAIWGCSNLTHGTFAFQAEGGFAATATVLALLLDDVKYNLTSCK